jgi:hypothetical protein
MCSSRQMSPTHQVSHMRFVPRYRHSRQGEGKGKIAHDMNRNPIRRREHLSYTHVSFVVSNTNHDVLSWGLNGFDLQKNSVHSEEVAWSKFLCLLNNNRIPKRLVKKGVYMVNVALTRSYKLRMSRPCKRCSTLLFKHSNFIKNVIWTNEEGDCCHSTTETILEGSKLSSGDARLMKMKE